MPLPLIINFFGSSGSGKSTAAAGIYHYLKTKKSCNVEMASEFAKDLTWEKNMTVLQHQIYVSATQLFRQERIESQVEVVVTDCPILLGLFYWSEEKNRKYKLFEDLYLEIFNSKNNLNFFMTRTKKYNDLGRNQSETESAKISDDIHGFLESKAIPFTTITSDEDGMHHAFHVVNIAIKKI